LHSAQTLSGLPGRPWDVAQCLGFGLWLTGICIWSQPLRGVYLCSGSSAINWNHNSPPINRHQGRRRGCV
jgi:hypothetical protein